jgi:ribosomal protein L21E
MVKRKKLRTRGKIQLSRYFQKLSEGESVAISKERTIRASFPDRMQGRTGVVEGKRGRSYIVNVKDNNKEKRFIIKPIHLKRIQSK